MLAYVDKTAKCVKCGKSAHLVVEGRRETWIHPGLVQHPEHDPIPDPATIKEVGQ
jgi:hypothetical protein